MAILNTTMTPLDCWIRHFSSTGNSRYGWKISGLERKAFTPAKLSWFKRFPIHSPHFRFGIQNIRRKDQTGMFSFRVRPLVCKWENQSGTKTLLIHHKSVTICSSVNLILAYCFAENLNSYRGTWRSRENKTHCFPADQSFVFLYTPPNSKIEKKLKKTAKRSFAKRELAHEFHAVSRSTTWVHASPKLLVELVIMHQSIPAGPCLFFTMTFINTYTHASHY